ncbi:hypothetical protein DEJ33_07520 [Curtobacterium sp. MCPF17_047]|uniref:hypothetical protein n=1 Tax=Curtobacterium sp. MCPF17_047 TaxID=2175654 RepID=UPI000DA7936A|nr:hypothetical protein [Curtobacterium sp. MCPF17_047]PZF67091.1 hypothetical protein DEJ33_07520 [Curtobacterium sp. MCPF17_047]
MTQRGSTWGFWLWAISGVVVSIAAGVLLGAWFRIAAAVTIGWGVFAVTAFPTRARLDVRQPWLWGFSAAMLVLLIGVSLLLGAVGLSNDERTDSPLPGAVLGGVLTAAGALSLLLGRAWRRRRAVDAEVERHRTEQRTADPADDPA